MDRIATIIRDAFERGGLGQRRLRVCGFLAKGCLRHLHFVSGGRPKMMLKANFFTSSEAQAYLAAKGATDLVNDEIWLFQ